LTIISEYTCKVDNLKATIPGLADQDFLTWRLEEIDYLKNLKKEPEHNLRVVAYVEALEALRKAEYVIYSVELYIYIFLTSWKGFFDFIS
jgi:hypothetical protein